VSQALAFAQGSRTIPNAGIMIPPVSVPTISNYPPGTSLLQAPFVWAFGWRGAALVSVLSLVGMTLVTARWLREWGRNPSFALLIPAFFATLLFGRIAMSDVPGGALVAVACWLLWRAERRGWAGSFAAGLAAGASLLFREPLVVLLAPLLLGAVARRSVGPLALVAGGLVAVASRLLVAQLVFGDPFYVRDAGIGFSPTSLTHTLPVYAVILLLMFPGGALLPFLYRGERRVELVSAIGAYVALFLFYDYDVIRSQGPIKGSLLAARFMIPATPLLVWMAAEVWPRMAPRIGVWRSTGVRLVTVGAAGVVLLSFAVHPAARSQEGDGLVIVRGIFEHTSQGVPVITNSDASLKYLSPAYGPRRLILRQGVAPDSVPVLLARHHALDLVMLDRTDSELFRSDAAANRSFLDSLRGVCELTSKHDTALSWVTLRVLSVERCLR
jgi:hypothetical protein